MRYDGQIGLYRQPRNLRNSLIPPITRPPRFSARAYHGKLTHTLAPIFDHTQPPKQDKASKIAKAMAGGKAKKKKWSKGRTKDKANNAVVFDKLTYDKLFKEVPTYKLITPSVLVDRLRINGSLARVAVRDLAAKGLIKPIVISKKQMIYTRATKDEDVPAASEKVEKKKVQKKKAADEEEEDDE
ncbi:hypothetical protein HDU77_003158 [Chytriomyces hyalinus]|nr:hypothetical protein HDU77_003158 [Chytriomyces hyalinus]